jgi:hypothetical protein
LLMLLGELQRPSIGRLQRVTVFKINRISGAEVMQF